MYMIDNRKGKVSCAWNLVRPKNSCESRHLFHSDIDAIDFPRVYSRWCRTTASAAFHIFAEVTVNVGFSEHSCSQATPSSRREVFSRDIDMTMVGGGVGESARNIWNQCVPRGHIVNRALRCWRLSTCYYSVPPLSLFYFFCLLVLCLSSIAAREIQGNPREIALSLTRETKVSRKEGRPFGAFATTYLRYTSKLLFFVL